MEERILVTIIGVLVIFNLICALRSKNRLAIFSPIVFISLIYFMYTVLGPIIFLSNDFNIFPEEFIRPFFVTAWWGALVSFGSIMLGYYFPVIHRNITGRTPAFIFNSDRVFRIGLLLSLIGLSLYTISNPGRMVAQINPFAVKEIQASEEISGFANYLSSSINFVIPGLCLMMLVLRKRLLTPRNLVFLFILLISLSLFISIAFRYRILVLLIALIVSYYLYRQKRPPLVWSLVTILLTILFIGIIGETRSYGAGIKLDKLEDKESVELLMTGFKDANVFPISGAVMNAVPSRVDYAGFVIIYNAIIFPIPRTFLPNKDTDSYIRAPIKTYRPLRAISAHKWAAMLYYAEWYAALGWAGIIMVSLLMGRIYKLAWIWANRNLEDPFRITIYAVSLGFAYIIISRGYFPFAVMSFFFLVFPAVIAKTLYRVKVYAYRPTA